MDDLPEIAQMTLRAMGKDESTSEIKGGGGSGDNKGKGKEKNKRGGNVLGTGSEGSGRTGGERNRKKDSSEREETG